jgi:hypothetical protein
MKALAGLLLHMRWQVIGRIVDVHKGSVDDGDRLEDVLQTLAMAPPLGLWGTKPGAAKA